MIEYPPSFRSRETFMQTFLDGKKSRMKRPGSRIYLTKNLSSKWGYCQIKFEAGQIPLAALGGVQAIPLLNFYAKSMQTDPKISLAKF